MTEEQYNQETVRLREKYKILVAWCKQMHSFDYYIDDQVWQAERENAPLDAIYERSGMWRTVSNMPDDHPFRKDIEKL